MTSPLKRTTLDDGTPFPMGNGRSRAVLSPAVGMTRITLNNSFFDDGDEFPQHRHDSSEDCMVVLHGAVSFKQGTHLKTIAEGDYAWVPIAEVHGTLNDSGGPAELISFQSPPDLALYRGDRNKTAGEVPVPEGDLLARTAALWSGAGDAAQRPV
ncbi:MAG: cupin domain-containing protein, partial [Leifsonia sp.]